MAKPVEFRPSPQTIAQGSRERTEQRLGAAPVEHAEAVLNAYNLLQELHDTGTLDLLRGMLGAGDKIVEEISAMLVLPETIRGIRNLIVLSRIMASIDPEVLDRMAGVLPHAVEPVAEEKPPSMFSLLKRLFSADARRGLALGLTAAETLGKATHPQPK